MTLVLGAALLAAAVVFYVLQPILSGQSAPLEQQGDELSDVEARRRVTLLALRDVEYDRATGKLDEDDYRTLRSELSHEALEALRAEEMEGAKGEGAGAFAAAAPERSSTVENDIARVREGVRAGLACLTCGHVNVSGSRFCTSCGTPLTAAASQANGQRNGQGSSKAP